MKKFAVFNSTMADTISEGPCYFVRKNPHGLNPECLGTFATRTEAEKFMERRAWPGVSLTLARKGRKRLHGGRGPNRWWAVSTITTEREEWEELD